MSRKIIRMTTRGFTIVELIIVIVVIAILAIITILSYDTVTEGAKDTQRITDIRAVADALELYYLDHGQYPSSAGGGGPPAGINGSWSTTTDGSWANLKAQLVPKYIPELPIDPENTTGKSVMNSTGYGYAYFRGAYCGSANGQMYILIMRLRGEQKDMNKGEKGACTTGSPLYYSGLSNWRTAN